MFNTYSERMTLRTCDCDMYGAWTPSAILTTMQEIAASHCTQLEIDFKHLDPLGIAWVLSSTHVSFDRVPRVGETVVAETYPTPVRHMFFPRMCVFRDEDGTQLGAAHSLWVLLDRTTRRVVPSDHVKGHIPDNSALKIPVAMPRPVRPLAVEADEAVYTPVFTDFDTNGHVNNTRYMDWCVDRLGMERMCEKLVTGFTVQYETEIRPGATVALRTAADGDAFVCQGFEGGKRLFSIGGTLGRRA